MVTKNKKVQKILPHELIDIKNAGCVIFKVPKNITKAQAKKFQATISVWAEELSVNYLIVTDDIQVEVIPSQIFQEDEILKRLQFIEKNILGI